MNNIIPFSYDNQDVSVIQDGDGNPWWVAKDVCGVLGIYDTGQAVEKLDNDEKLMRTLHVSGQHRDIWTVNEAGLYSLIFRSNKSEAKKFKRWIAHEVLPSIRKHRFYGTDSFVEDALNNPDSMIAILKKYKSERRQRGIAEQQRDLAIKTKAWIGEKREATAMNTASQLSKENQRLKEQVGDSKTWKQARSIPWLKSFFVLNNSAYAQIGKRLSKESRLMGCEIREMPHSKWGTIKVYHSDVIEHFRHKLIDDLNLLKNYRRYPQGVVNKDLAQ